MREVSSTIFRQANPSGFRKQDSSKEKMYYYINSCWECIDEPSLANYWMASRLNEKSLFYLFVFTKERKVVVVVVVRFQFLASSSSHMHSSMTWLYIICQWLTPVRIIVQRQIMFVDSPFLKEKGRHSFNAF